MHCSFLIHLINAIFHEKKTCKLFYLAQMLKELIHSVFRQYLNVLSSNWQKLFMLSTLLTHASIHKKIHKWHMAWNLVKIDSFRAFRNHVNRKRNLLGELTHSAYCSLEKKQMNKAQNTIREMSNN